MQNTWPVNLTWEGKSPSKKCLVSTPYADGKVFGFICDNKLFIKPISAAKKYIVNVVEGEAYPGSKMYYLIEEKLDDVAWISGLVKAMWDDLPEPKPKKKKT